MGSDAAYRSRPVAKGRNGIMAPAAIHADLMMHLIDDPACAQTTAVC